MKLSIVLLAFQYSQLSCRCFFGCFYWRAGPAGERESIAHWTVRSSFVNQMTHKRFYPWSTSTDKNPSTHRPVDPITPSPPLPYWPIPPPSLAKAYGMRLSIYECTLAIIWCRYDLRPTVISKPPPTLPSSLPWPRSGVERRPVSATVVQLSGNYR